MNREDLSNILQGNNRFGLFLRKPKNKQVKRENIKYRDIVKNLNLIVDSLNQDGYNIDILRNSIKTRNTIVNNIVDDYDDINAEKLYARSWKEKRKSKYQHRGIKK